MSDDVQAAYKEATEAILAAHAQEMRAIEDEARSITDTAQAAEDASKLSALKKRLFGTDS